MGHVVDRWHTGRGDARRRTSRYGSGKRWRARWTGPDGREREKSFESKVAAEQYLAGVATSIAVGGYVDPRAGRDTVGVWLDKWLATKADREELTVRGYKSKVELYVRPRWGRIRIDQVDHTDVAQWVAQLPLGASGAAQALGPLRGALDLAVKSKRLVANPALGIKIAKGRKGSGGKTRPKRALGHDGVIALLEATRPDYVAAMATLAYGAPRISELIALDVADVDLDRWAVHVHKAAVHVGGRQVLKDVKNHRDRWVGLPKSIDLKALVRGRYAEEPLFPAPRGKRLSYTSFRRNIYDQAVEAAGVGPLTPHELRHTGISLAIAAGATVKDIQKMAGHESAAVTLDVYGHEFDEGAVEVARRVESEAAVARALAGAGTADVVSLDAARARRAQ